MRKKHLLLRDWRQRLSRMLLQLLLHLGGPRRWRWQCQLGLLPRSLLKPAGPVHAGRRLWVIVPAEHHFINWLAHTDAE